MKRSLKPGEARRPQQTGDLLGLLRHAEQHRAAGRLDDALACFRQAHDMAPNEPAIAGGLGIVLREIGRVPEAIELLGASVRRNPGSAGLIATLGSALQADGDLRGAIARYREALTLDRGLVPARANLGLALFELGALEQAICAYEAALTQAPNSAELHGNLGWALFAASDINRAAEHVTRAVSLRPDAALWHEKLGLIHLANGDIDGAAAAFARDAALARGPAWSDEERVAGKPRALATTVQRLAVVSAYKLGHDADQLRHLRAQGLVGPEADDLLSRYDDIRRELETRHGREAVMPIDTLAARLGPAFGAPYFMPECPALPGGALNPALDGAALEARYFAARPEAVTIDGLLRAEALEALRAFCRGATMWNDVKRGYMGAYLRHGFGAPLLLQIAAELRRTLPTLLGPHPLIEMWAYKYDQALNGIETHADCAAVNVNFWLAPDEANLDPASGGLEVFAAEAPSEWDFHRYNHDRTAIEQFLDASGRRSVIVPHRANRAVLFNSNLFHRTHDPRFAPGYANRRINVTMLFGFRKTNAA